MEVEPPFFIAVDKDYSIVVYIEYRFFSNSSGIHMERLHCEQYIMGSRGLAPLQGRSEEGVRHPCRKPPSFFLFLGG